MLRFLLPPLLVLLQHTPDSAERRFFRFEREMLMPQTDSGQMCVSLDTDVIKNSRSDLGDVRLFRRNGEVPYVLHIGRAGESGRYQLPKIFNVGELNGKTVFDANLTNRFYQSLSIDTKATDFVAIVDVYGSHTSEGRERTKLGTFTIFDVRGSQPVRRTSIDLPRSNFAHLHFEIGGKIKPVDIVGVSVLDTDDSQLNYQTIAEHHNLQIDGRNSVVSIKLDPLVSVERVTIIDNAGRDFVRNVRVDRVDGGKTISAAGGTIYRFNTLRNGIPLSAQQTHVDIPASYRVLGENGLSEWRVTVENGDDAPLAIKSVLFEMRDRRLCFDASQGESYTLMYGDSVLTPPKYDYANLFEPSLHPAIARLGSEKENAQYVHRPDTRPWTERFPVVLWIALGVVVVVLGVVAVRSTDKV